VAAARSCSAPAVARARPSGRCAKQARARSRSGTAPELLVNCTSVGLQAEPQELAALALSADALGEYGVVVDLVYRSGRTALLDAAAQRGARTVDGLEILVAQGALSLELWTGRSAPLQVMQDVARAAA
jgi:shikimate dehydrogenase